MSLKKLSTLLKHTDTQKLTALWEITPIRFLFWQHVFEDHLLVIDATFMYNVQANDIKMSLLLHLGRDYPKGYDYFRGKLKNAFFKHKDVTDPKQIEMLLARGNYVVKELEALYMLRKYRTLKKRYYSD